MKLVLLNTSRFSRRSAVLALLGITWLLFAYSMFTTNERDRFSQPGPSPLEWADSRWWALLWAASGLVGVGVAMRRKSAKDALGFAAIQGSALTWLCLHAYSLLVWLVTGGVYGQPVYTGLLIWGAVCFLIRIIAEALSDEPIRGKSALPPSGRP